MDQSANVSTRSGRTNLPADIAVVEPTGSETLLNLRLGGGEDHIVEVFHERRAFAPAESVHLRPFADQAHLFDAETGQRP